MAKSNSPLILGTRPIGKLLLQYSIPAIIGMTVTSLYNIIDSVFIGHGVGALGIAGLAITFPLMNLRTGRCRRCYDQFYLYGTKRYATSDIRPTQCTVNVNIQRYYVRTRHPIFS